MMCGINVCHHDVVWHEIFFDMHGKFVKVGTRPLHTILITETHIMFFSIDKEYHRKRRIRSNCDRMRK